MSALRPLSGGLRRLVGAPLLWLTLVVVLAVVAHVAGLRIQMVVATALGPFDVLDLDRVLFGTADAIRDHTAIAGAVEMALLSSAVLSVIVWTLLSPAIITRLEGRAPLAELGGRILSMAAPVVVQSLWHLLLRALVMGALGLLVQPLPPLGYWLVLALGWCLCTAALDVTRVQLVLHDSARWHVRTALSGLRTAATRPTILIPSLLLSALQWGLVALTLWLALRSFGGGSAWVARLLSGVTVGLGLWRIGVVVEGLTPRD